MMYAVLLLMFAPQLLLGGTWALMSSRSGSRSQRHARTFTHLTSLANLTRSLSEKKFRLRRIDTAGIPLRQISLNPLHHIMFHHFALHDVIDKDFPATH